MQLPYYCITWMYMWNKNEISQRICQNILKSQFISSGCKINASICILHIYFFQIVFQCQCSTCCQNVFLRSVLPTTVSVFLPAPCEAVATLSTC